MQLNPIPCDYISQEGFIYRFGRVVGHVDDFADPEPEPEHPCYECGEESDVALISDHDHYCLPCFEKHIAPLDLQPCEIWDLTADPRCAGCDLRSCAIREGVA